MPFVKLCCVLPVVLSVIELKLKLSKTAGAVEVRMMSMNDGSDTESNITHTEMQICGDLA